jgi:hypothetical protein
MRLLRVLLLALQPIRYLPDAKDWKQISLSVLILLGFPVSTVLGRWEEFWPELPSWWFSVVVFSVVSVILFFRAAYQLQSQVDCLNNLRPNIEVADPDGFYVDKRGFSFRNVSDSGVRYSPLGAEEAERIPVPVLDASCAHVRFVNIPKPGFRGVTASSVCARVTYRDSAENNCFIDGRWADTDQPSSRDPRLSRNDLLRVDFQPGATHEVDIVFKDPADAECYAINNDSFSSGTLKNLQWRLTGEIVDVEVRLMAESVDQSFSFRFRNLGKGHDLEVIEKE